MEGPGTKTISGEGAGAATIPVGDGTAGEGGGTFIEPTSPCCDTIPPLAPA